MLPLHSAQIWIDCVVDSVQLRESVAVGVAYQYLPLSGLCLGTFVNFPSLILREPTHK